MWTTVVFSVFFVMTFVDCAVSEGNGASLTSLKPRISEFKTTIHRILEGNRIRKKRQLDESDPLVYKLKFGSTTPGDLPYLSDFNLTFWTPVYEKHSNQVLIGTTGGHLILFQVSDENDKTAVTAALSESEDLAIKARAFTYYDEQWFAVLHYSDRESYIRMYQRIGRGLERRQKIDLTSFADMELVTLKGIHYLVVSTYSSSVGQVFSYQASVTLYHWTQTQFDAIASRTTYGARSVVCWIFHGSLYIAVVQETNDDGNFEVGSPILLYNSKEENSLVLWEMLATFRPTKVEHFYVAGSHYIVVIGKRDAVIYWWSSGQFLEWQSLSGTADASDVSVLALGNGEVAIVIALKEEALFYTLDSSGMYFITFTMVFRGSSLRSLHFMFSGRAYYALALFAGSHQHSIWKLTLTSHYLPSVPSLDPLQQCLLDIQQLLNERKTELETINADLNRVWLKGSNQNITTKVIVEGSITSSQQSRVKDIIIIKYANVPDASMSFVIAKLVELNDLSEEAKRELDGTVLRSTRQEIRGFKFFKDHVYVPSLSMETTANVVINDIEISRLQNYALRRKGDQLLNATLISSLYSETASVANVNGISTDDFLLLHGKQTVTGSLAFSDIFASSASVRLLNSIPTKDIITTDSLQNIRDLKTFSFLKSHAIDVQGETNQVDLSSIHEKVAITDNYDEFTGRLTFTSPVTINGSMFLTGKINRMVDISNLVHTSVDLNSQQDLTGRFTFKGNQTIAGDVLVGGSINKISLDNLLTLSSNQKMYSDISFLAPVTVNRDLVVDKVNSVDLSEEALRKTAPYQFLNGRKIFTQDITADFVDMTEYVTLDGVDPSLLIQDIVRHEEGIVKQKNTVLKDVDVLGDLIVIGNINGLDILDFVSSVWLKSADQHISVPVTASYFHVQKNLFADVVNNLNLESDIVHSFMDEVIEGPKTFEFKTVFDSLNTSNGAINGINLKSFRIEIERYRNEGEVQGVKSMDSLSIAGNLKVTKLNELQVTDIMQPNANQIVKGPVEFTNEITQIQGNVHLDAISFTGVFNGENLHNYFRNTVMLKQSYKPLGNKYFMQLKGTSLSIPPASTVSGVSLNELVQRAVILNVPQLITASKTFTSNLNFVKLVNIATMNGLELSSYINEIVLTDEVSRLSHKHFLRSVQAENAFVRGVINGIKMEEIASSVFYKSEDNVISEHFVFEGDIDVGNLISPMLDEVEWKDLIFLKNDEVLGAGWFLSKAHVDGDIFVTGLLNGCDLSQISSSLYTNKSTQIIKKRIDVQNVIVVGNLIVKRAINKISLKELQNFVTTSDDQIITSDAVIEANLIVDELLLTDRANSNLEFILQDAVKRSVYQEIIGQKVFKDSVAVAVLSGGHMFATKVNGIDLEELELTAVWKNGYQEINGDKVFSLLILNVASVNGYLNGISLPEDVVKTDDSEHIAHPTYFMSDVYVTTELLVHGLIDGVDLNELIQRRVTLNTDQNVSAELTFHNDAVAYGELIIDGTVNEIVLDLVAKVKPTQIIHGYKIFVEFHVSGPVTASSVNGFDVAELSNNIPRYNKDDYINGMQVFDKPVQAQNSLYVEWINVVPIRQLTAAFTAMMSNLQSILGYLEDLSFNIQKQLNIQMLATQDQVNTFAYFTLFQEVDIRPTSRILYGYDFEYSNSRFSHSLVMWTTEKHCVFMEKCCHLEFSYWLRVQKNGIVMVDGGAEPGRYYPIFNSSPISSKKDFYIWTNSSDAQPKWCTDRSARMVLASSDSAGLREKFIDMESSALLSDVKSFRRGHLYAVASFYFDHQLGEYSSTVVYMYDEKRHWSKHQVLPSYGVLSLDITGYSQGYREDILLALGTGMSTEPSYSTVYKWNNEDGAFDLLQNIPSRYVTSTLWILNGRDLLLALAGVDYWPNKALDCLELVSGGQIDIYLYKEHLTWIQSIPVDGIVSMVSFSVDGDAYLAAASRPHQMIYLFQWKGYAGFVQTQTISAEVRHLNIYNIHDDVYMTVASASGPSKILKMVRKGKKPTSIERFDLISLEQRDEVTKETKVVKGC